MLRLANRSRRVLLLAGALAAVASFASLPLLAEPLWRHAPGTSAENDVAVVWPPDMRAVRLPPIDDPFARALPEEPAPLPAGVHRSIEAGKSLDVRVQAIIQGKPPLALVQDGTTRIVAVGDTIEGARITAIAPDRILLANGKRLTLEDERR